MDFVFSILVNTNPVLLIAAAMLVVAFIRHLIQNVGRRRPFVPLDEEDLETEKEESWYMNMSNDEGFYHQFDNDHDD